MFNFFNKFKPKKPLKPDSDLLSEFLETDSEFTQNRQNYYLKFKAKNKAEKASFKFILQQNLLWVSCFLVTIVSFVGGVNLQAQQSNSQPFIANDQQRVVRFESCNVDVALPKKIDGVNTFLIGTKNVELENSKDTFFNPAGISLGKATDPTNTLDSKSYDPNLGDISLNCFSKNDYLNFQKFIDRRFKKAEFSEKSTIEVKSLTLDEAGKRFGWQIFKEPKIQNVRLLKLSTSEYIFDQFLGVTFEFGDKAYAIYSTYSYFSEATKNSGTDKVESYLKQIDLKPISESQADYQKIEFDEYGNYYEYGVSPVELSFFDDLLSRIYSPELFNLLNILFLIAFLASSLAFFVFVNKKINQNQLKLNSRISLYAIFINCLALVAIFIQTFFTSFSADQNGYNGSILAISVFSQLGILFLDVILGLRKSTKKENFTKIALLISGIVLIGSNLFSYILMSLQIENYYLWSFYWLLLLSVNFAIPIWWLVVFGINLKKSLPWIVSVLSKEKTTK